MAIEGTLVSYQFSSDRGSTYKTQLRKGLIQSRAINVGIDWSIDFESKISKNIDFDIDIDFELD